MEFYIGLAVVFAVIFGMAAIASWRRRGPELLPDQRDQLANGENVLRQKAHPKTR
jgi:hypothetical protein